MRWFRCNENWVNMVCVMMSTLFGHSSSGGTIESAYHYASIPRTKMASSKKKTAWILPLDSSTKRCWTGSKPCNKDGSIKKGVNTHRVCFHTDTVGRHILPNQGIFLLKKTNLTPSHHTVKLNTGIFLLK